MLTKEIRGLLSRTKGRFYLVLGNLPKALENYQKSLNLHLEIGNKYYIALSYLDIGNLFYTQRNYIEALKNFLQSDCHFKDDFDKRENIYGKLLMAISLSNYHLNKIDRAKEYCEKAMRIFSVSRNRIEFNKSAKWNIMLIQIEQENKINNHN